MVYMEEVTNLMDQMMKVDIFDPSEKHQMLKDNEKTFLDPNLIMEERHRMLRENSTSSNSSVFAEAKKSLKQEERKESYIKRQQRFLERELKRFEMELKRSRPKFSESYGCRKRNFAPSDDENFWESTRNLRSKIIISEERRERCRERSLDKMSKKIRAKEKDDSLPKKEDEKILKETQYEALCIGSIKVTIKGKTDFEAESHRLSLLKKYFDVLKRNAVEQRRFRENKMKIQQNMILKITRKYFDVWRTRAEEEKRRKKEKKVEQESSEERKIELFINTIVERQREIMKSKKLKSSADVRPATKESSNADTKKKSASFKRVLVESPPAQSRLNAQKQIIEKQKAKLAEQNRLIEELKLRQMQNELSRVNKETIDAAKGTLTYCGEKTRRTLIQLMHQNGYRDESLTVPRKAPDPPKFLLRMETRAEARRNRIKLAEESRRQRLEEQRRKEEAAKMEEEEKKRRLQQEALTEARRLRREEEENRRREMEKSQRLNNLANEFYRKYLLKRYIMRPFVMLIDEKQKNVKKSDDYFRKKMMKRVFTAWKKETETQCETKIEIVESFHNENLAMKVFKGWKQMTRETNLKHQVAIDFHDMKVLVKYFNLWQIRTVEIKAQYAEKEKLANNLYEKNLKVKYLGLWKKYLTIVEDIKEREKRKNELRQLVQKVIPDFNPKQRGVALDD